MGVSVAEYLGQRTDVSKPLILPVLSSSSAKCPFMNSFCSKVHEKNKPICSVRKQDGTLWIACRHRLCSTKSGVKLSNHQVTILLNVAKTVFHPNITPDKVCVKREQAMRVVGRSRYHADFVMLAIGQSLPYQSQAKVVLEMQGGGETSNTGLLTKHVKAWEDDSNRTNKMLSTTIDAVGTLETNAWRRQQEQFLVKGNIAMQTGGVIVFCVGAPLYDYLSAKVLTANLKKMREHNWSLAIIGFSEYMTSPPMPGAIPLKIDKKRLLFTSYNYFVNALTSQGDAAPHLFNGSFDTLAGGTIVIQ